MSPISSYLPLKRAWHIEGEKRFTRRTLDILPGQTTPGRISRIKRNVKAILSFRGTFRWLSGISCQDRVDVFREIYPVLSRKAEPRKSNSIQQEV